jgi:hypothetical protein
VFFATTAAPCRPSNGRHLALRRSRCGSFRVLGVDPPWQQSVDTEAAALYRGWGPRWARRRRFESFAIASTKTPSQPAAEKGFCHGVVRSTKPGFAPHQPTTAATPWRAGLLSPPITHRPPDCDAAQRLRRPSIGPTKTTVQRDWHVFGTFSFGTSILHLRSARLRSIG